MQSRSQKASHSQYSIQISPSDFDHLGRIQELMTVSEFPVYHARFERARHIFVSIEKADMLHFSLARIDQNERFVFINSQHVEFQTI
jgi:hypothetical protein